MKEMNQEVANKAFNHIAYLESLLDWDNAMIQAHGGTYNRKTSSLLKELKLMKNYLYENEISDECKAEYDGLANGGIYYHSLIEKKNRREYV